MKPSNINKRNIENKENKRKNFKKFSNFIKRKLKLDNRFEYIRRDVATFFSGVLYYLIKELFIISIHTLVLNNKTTITPRTIYLTIKSDEEFENLLKK
ncbi:hypothetical protein DICPUDRAFT_159977, partial [Dictyostelium purpureum]